MVASQLSVTNSAIPEGTAINLAKIIMGLQTTSNTIKSYCIRSAVSQRAPTDAELCLKPAGKLYGRIRRRIIKDDIVAIKQNVRFAEMPRSWCTNGRNGARKQIYIQHPDILLGSEMTVPANTMSRSTGLWTWIRPYVFPNLHVSSFLTLDPIDFHCTKPFLKISYTRFEQHEAEWWRNIYFCVNFKHCAFI